MTPYLLLRHDVTSCLSVSSAVAKESKTHGQRKMKNASTCLLPLLSRLLLLPSVGSRQEVPLDFK